MYDAGIQMHGTSKPIVNPYAVQPIQPIQRTSAWNGRPKTMKERRKELLLKKDFLDKRTIKYLKKAGLINTNE